MNDVRVEENRLLEAAHRQRPDGSERPGENPQPSAGALLRSAREAAGLHIAALAVALKVPVKKLEALEQDRMDLLPDATFARALAASVCRNLRVDPGPMLERLPKSGSPKLSLGDKRLQQAFGPAGGARGRRSLANISKPALASGFVLLAGALALVFLPNIQRGVTLAKEQADIFLASRSPDTAPLVLDLTSIPSISTNPVSAASDADRDTAAGRTPSTERAEAREDSSQASSGALAPPKPGEILTLSATRESWVKVTDAKGVVVLRRLLAAGEVAGASGALPLEAVVGRADATRVEVRGKVLDLAPVTRDNVARFEVR